MSVNIDKIVQDAEKEVKDEYIEEKKEELKIVIREIEESKEITKRLNAKKDRLISDLKC